MEEKGENIRNFVIIAHIDHGKSTLADRFLEITNTIPQTKLNPQYLDRLNIEREHGITIKMHPVRMSYRYQQKQEYILNLIDTPGHVDFTYEVSRSLAAVEGAILLVDGLQGIQAQTLSNLFLAQKQGLQVIGSINKIDLDIPNLNERRKELAQLLNQKMEDIIPVSAKTGENVGLLLDKIITEIPSPSFNLSAPLRALVFDSVYNNYKGVIAYIRIIDGVLRKGDKIKFLAKKVNAEVTSLGYFKPQLIERESLSSGEIGWVATGLKDPNLVRVGDTITLEKETVIALSGYKEPQPMVFASFYLGEGQDFEKLRLSLNKLKLTDSALQFSPENSEVLGRGYRLGFLGMLHAKITQERLKKNYNLDLIVTNPTVSYQVWLKSKSAPIIVTNPGAWPPVNDIERVEEPWAQVEIITPSIYLSNVIQLIHQERGENVISNNINDRLLIRCQLPLEETIKEFYDKLKSVSQGYASMNYQLIGYRKVELEKLEVLLMGKEFSGLARLVLKEEAEKEARQLARDLKELIPQQVYAVPIQVRGLGRILARETIPALRKDVTAHLYGGDRTRKMKLWKKQKKGKKRLAQQARLKIPSDVFLKLFTRH